MAKHNVYCTRPSRYDGEHVDPGTKFVVEESEMPGLISSNRFVTEARWNDLQDEFEAAAKKAKTAKSAKSDPAL